MNQATELAIIGAILRMPTLLADANLSADDFTEPLAKQAYAAIVQLDGNGETPHFRPVVDALSSAIPTAEEKLGPIVRDTLNSDITQFASNVQKVVDASTRRRLVWKLSELTSSAADDKIPLGEIADDIEAVLFEASLRRSKRDFRRMADVMPRVVAQVELAHEKPGVLTGCPSGFIDVDEITNGFQPSDLIVLAARPSVGKSALAGSVAFHAAQQGLAVAIFSFEMGEMAITKRFLSLETQIPLKRLRSGRLSDAEITAVQAAPAQFRNLPIYLEDRFDQSIHSVRQQARRLATQVDVRLIVVDYMQLMTAGGKNRTEEVGQISRGLKTMANDLNVPVIGISQLNRGVESRGDPAPKLADLRESGSIEQDADIVMFLYRRSDEPSTIVVDIAKHRNGELATRHLHFQPEIMRFSNAVGLRDAS